MNVNKILLGLLVTLTLLSCKNESQKTTEESSTEKTAVNENAFVITFNAIVKKDDSFQVYFKAVDDDKVPFEEKNSMYVDVKGSDQPQDIVFSLPEDALPNQIRLDYGINKEQSEIKVNGLSVKYLGKTIDLKGAEFFKHFIFNQSSVKIDTVKSTITPIMDNGNYDPMSYSEKLLNDKLLGLTK
jgi:hypothetical protein